MKIKKLTKKIAEELMAFKGEARGMEIKIDGEFVLKRHGIKSLKKVEEKLKEIGSPIEYKNIKSMDFYFGRTRILSLLAIKDVLEYTNADIKELGTFASKNSFFVKFFIKYFESAFKFFFKQSPKMWKKYWTTGELLPLIFDKKNKIIIMQVKDFNLHPVYCRYLEGYFIGLAQLLIRGEKITCQETKCFFKGDKVHEFLIKW